VLEWELEVGWLVDSIRRVVGDWSSTLFWEHPWMEGTMFYDRYMKLYELVKNKMTTMDNLHSFS